METPHADAARIDEHEAARFAPGAPLADESASRVVQPATRNARGCDRSDSDVAAYLDAELGAAGASSFEEHVKSCQPCAAALAEQRRLLCLLDAAFRPAENSDVALPEDFARVLKARAQTDVGGVRRVPERRRALALICALASLSLALIGLPAVAAALAPLRSLAAALAAVLDMTLHTAGEAFTGVALVLRGFGRYLVSEPAGGSALVFVALACAVLLLLRLISNYHRAQLHD